MALWSWSDEEEWEEDEFSSLDTADEDTDSDDGDVEDKCILEKLLSVWSKLSPSVQRSDIIDEWFAGIYETKKRKLYIGCLLKRFLKDEESDNESMEMSCFKPKVGRSTVIEDTPDCLPDFFKIHVIIDGPLNVLPLHGKKWDIPDYESIFQHFQEVSHLNRKYMNYMF